MLAASTLHDDGIQRTQTRVRVVLGASILEGDHTHPAGVRLSDSLRNAASTERYLLLTSVTVRALDGSDAKINRQYTSSS